MEYIQDEELRLFSHKELFCKIWEEVVGELPGSQDCRVNLQGKDFQFSGDAASHQAWEGASTQFFPIENFLDSLQGYGLTSLENQQFPAWRAIRLIPIQGSWAKAFVNQSGDVQERCENLNTEDTVYKCNWDDYSFCWMSCHADHRFPEIDKRCGCNKCREDCIKNSVLHHNNPGENGLKSNEYGNGFRDNSDLPPHPRDNLSVLVTQETWVCSGLSPLLPGAAKERRYVRRWGTGTLYLNKEHNQSIYHGK
ncbi:hypothetical protein H8959_005899 [Pygathrix nigripes]